MSSDSLAPGAHDQAQLNVLVIEDDPDLQQLIAGLVTGRGHQVATADSAEEGLDLLPHWTFQVAILDHNLPGMEGLLLGEYLRRHNPHMTIALVTGDDDTRLPGKSRAAEIKFIPKPFEPGDIHRLLSDYIEAAQERQSRHQTEDAELFIPPIRDYVDQLEECYAIPKVPGRLEKRIVGTLKRHINNLRSASRYTERDRVVALSGLLSAKVLGIDLPRASSGRTLYEEYDSLMAQHGRRPEFSTPEPA